MTIINRKHLKHLLLTAVLLGLALPAFAQNYWTGSGGDLNWNTSGNWSSGVPISSTVTWFEDAIYATGYTNAAGLVNNIASSGSVAGSAYYRAQAASGSLHFYTTLIPGGVTLTLGGGGFTAPALAVGDIPGSWLSSGTSTNYSTITGGGILAVSDTTGVMTIGQRNRATLDLTGLNTFTANLQQVWVGVTSDSTTTTGPTGALRLGQTNNVTTAPNLSAPGILMGAATNASATALVFLGATNIFDTDGLVVGGRRSSSTFLYFGPAYSNSPSPGNFTLRGSAGGSTPVSVFSIGDSAANVDGYSTAFPGSTASATGTADFSGAPVDILADSIYIGRASAATQVASGTGTGTLIVEQGTVTATNVYIAYKPQGATNASIGQGTLILRSNAVMNVTKDVALVYRTNGTSFIGESRITVSNNAVLNVGGNLTTTHTIGSWTPASVALDGGTINMTGGGTVFIPTLLANNGSFTGASMVTVTNSLALGTVAAPFKPAAAGTLLVANNLTLGTNMPLSFKLGADTTVGGGVNDLVGVANNLTLNNNPITLTFTAPLVTGTYLLMTNGGTQTGTATWTNPTRSTATLVQNSTSVGIQVSSAAPANLVMAGTTPATNWGLTNVVWNSNTEKFYQLDNVLFDDTATATNVTLVANITPGSVTVSNNTKPFALNTSSSGPAWISGYGSLTKDGTGLLLVNGVNNNFYGPVNIKNGSIKLGFANSGEQFGTAGATNPITIFNGATLEVANYVGSANSYGRPAIIAGSGVGGAGAIIGSASFTTAGITLTDDATIGCPTATRLSITGVLAPYNNAFDLGSHTLTFSGNEVRLSQMTMTNGGAINVNSASLSLQNSIIAGTGNLNLGSKNLNFNNWSTGYVAKPFIVNGGSISIASAGTPPIIIGSLVTLNGSLTITNSQVIRLTNSLTGVGALVKYGTANLSLEAANNYSGSTTVAAGTLALTNGGSLTSPLITVNSAAGFNVAGLAGGYTVPSGQTVQVDGAAVGNLAAGAGGTLRGGGSITGLVSVASGGTLAVGSPTVGGTLTVSTNLTFNGGTNAFKLGGPDDLVAVGGNLTFTAPTVIRIDPVGPLTGSHILYTYSGSISGVDTNNLIFSSPRPLAFVLDTNTPGVVSLNISGSVTLDWAGGAPSAPTAWNVNTTSNWLNSGTPDIFFAGDSVVFGEGANTNLVSLATTMQPAGVTMNNSATAYTFTGAGGLTAGSLSMNGGGSLTLSNAGNVTLTGSGVALTAGTLTFAQTTNTTLTAKLSGSGGLAKTGASILTVSSADSTNFTGAVAVNGGTIRAGSVNALGASAITVGSGATLDINGQIGSLSSVSVSGVGADGQGAINNRGGQQVNAINNVTLLGNTTLGAASNRWDVAPVDTNGTPGIFNGNNFNLTKTGTNDLWLRQLSDTGLGDIDITAGRLIFAGAGTLSGNTSSNIVVRTNAVLGFGGGVQDPGKSTLIAPGGQLYASGSANQFGGNTVLSNGLVKLESNAGLTLGGNLSGPATLQFQGVAAGTYGTLTLSGSNSYSGGTIVNEGLLVFASSNSLPASSNVVLSSRSSYNTSGHPYVSLGDGVATPAGVLLDMQTVGSAGAAQASLGGNGGTWGGAIRITGNSANCTARFQADGTNGLTVVNAVDGTGFTGGGTIAIAGNGCDTTTMQGVGVHFSSSLVISNGTLSQTAFGGSQGSPQMPKLFLGAPGNYWTSMLFYRGVIQIGAHNALPLTPISVGHAFDGDHRFILDLNGYNQTVANFSDRFDNNDPVWFGNSSTNADSVLTFAINGTNTCGPFIVDAFDTNAPIQRKTSLAVTAGRLRLITPGINSYWANQSAYIYTPSGPLANTYTGPTTVTGGTLEVDGINLGPSAVTVGSGGMLCGSNGIFTGPVTIAAGGILAPGTSIGTLFMSNNLVLAGTCQMEVNLTAGTSDKVVGISTLLYGGTLVITNVGAQAFSNGTVLKLFDAAIYGFAGSLSIQPGSPGSGLYWDASQLSVDGTLHVTDVAPPLPPAPTINSFTPVTGGYSISFTGQNGAAYSLRASSNASAPASSWTVLQSAMQVNGSITFTDVSGSHPQRYYIITSP
jgi:fibronectin-binding autotransporter adhesin